MLVGFALGALGAGSLEAQPFVSGSRGSFTRGHYFGPHRPFTSHRSAHIGLLGYDASRYTGRGLPRYRYQGYRSPLLGYERESVSYRYTVESGYGHGCAGGVRSAYPFSSPRHFGYYLRDPHDHDALGALGYPDAWVLDGNLRWRAPWSPFDTPFRSQASLPWRARMEMDLDRREVAGASGGSENARTREGGPDGSRSPESEAREAPPALRLEPGPAGPAPPSPARGAAPVVPPPRDLSRAPAGGRDRGALAARRAVIYYPDTGEVVRAEPGDRPGTGEREVGADHVASGRAPGSSRR